MSVKLCIIRSNLNIELVPGDLQMCATQMPLGSKTAAVRRHKGTVLYSAFYYMEAQGQASS